MKIAGMYNVPFPNGKYKELKWIRHTMELWGKEIEQRLIKGLSVI